MIKKRIHAILMIVLLLLPFTAGGENGADFRIDENRVLSGMSRSWLQGYEPEIVRNTMTLILPVESDRAEGSIHTELLIRDESVSPFKPQSMSAETRRMGGTYPVRLVLELYPDRKNGDYPCTIRITGADANGNPMETRLPFRLCIRDGEPNVEHQRIVISDIHSDLKAGEEGEIHVVLSNLSRTVVYEDPVLQMTDTEDGIIPRTVDRLYLESLAPGESAEVIYPVTVRNKAAVAPHSVRVDLSWTALGQPKNQTEYYTIPVSQEIQLEQGGVRMPPSIVAGDSATISLPLMNMGKADVVNVLAVLTLPGITDRQSVLVGTVPPGETRQAQITVHPGREISGEFEGQLTVEAEDPDGNPTSFSLPVFLTVEKPAIENRTISVAEKKDEVPILNWVLGGGCGVLFLLLLLQGTLLRRKIHRLEEEKV